MCVRCWKSREQGLYQHTRLPDSAVLEAFNNLVGGMTVMRRTIGEDERTRMLSAASLELKKEKWSDIKSDEGVE